MSDDDRTRTHAHAIDTAPPEGAREVSRFSLEIADGTAPRAWHAEGTRCAIGSHASNDLVIDHPTVSRFHSEIEVSARGACITDRGSTNGTVVDGVRVERAWLADRSVIHVGAVALRFSWAVERVHVPLSDRKKLGPLVGASIAMREVFAVLERCAKSDATVLITGETGTGKEGAAEAIHEESARADGPFEVIDCASIPPALLESELFGHEAGAFTGAIKQHKGAFERAHGGTVFLDEIGELPTDLQPKLLRVLEDRTFRRTGGVERIPIDVRVIAATRRSLEAEVNAGTFRSDLYYRLAVLRVHLPPLRDRLEDLPLLVDAILDRLGATDRERVTSSSFLRRLRGASWPGNVRELRNAIERALVLEVEPSVEPGTAHAIDPRLGWTEARQLALDDFERRYLAALLSHHGDNVTKAARAAGLDRVYLHRLLRRHGLRG
jgi:two-component system response regulator GlrR